MRVFRRNKVPCNLCNNTFSKSNIAKHIAVCTGHYRKITHCRHCNKLLDNTKTNANHVKWCQQNPDRSMYLEQLKEFRKLMLTPAALAKRGKSISKAHNDGKYDKSYAKHRGLKGRTHSDETKEKLRKLALASDHQRVCKSTKEYICKDGTIVLLDSSWEIALAKRLDELNISWTRPKPIKWIDKNNKLRNYFPDFYLVDYNIYLDPKNPYVVKSQKEKLSWLKSNRTDVIILTSLTEIENYNPPVSHPPSKWTLTE